MPCACAEVSGQLTEVSKHLTSELYPQTSGVTLNITYFFQDGLSLHSNTGIEVPTLYMMEQAKATCLKTFS